MFDEHHFGFLLLQSKHTCQFSIDSYLVLWKLQKIVDNFVSKLVGHEIVECHVGQIILV